jgi:hypothetical protein
MGLNAFSQLARRARPLLRHGVSRWFCAIGLALLTVTPVFVFGQLVSTPVVSTPAASGDAASVEHVRSHTIRARHFLGGRTLSQNFSAAQAMDRARQQHAAMLLQQAALPQNTSLSTPWQPIGPNQVASIAYGDVTGRVTAIAIDPADATGNTVYLGTTGGGVWKSTNAAGPSASVTFAPLTDTLPVFSANAGTAAIPSLSIGAISVQSGVVLAGTGDPNDASDSFYGSGLLRSSDGGLTWTLIQNSQDGVAAIICSVDLALPGSHGAARRRAQWSLRFRRLPRVLSSMLQMRRTASWVFTIRRTLALPGTCPRSWTAARLCRLRNHPAAILVAEPQPRSSGTRFGSASTRRFDTTASTSRRMAQSGRAWRISPEPG